MGAVCQHASRIMLKAVPLLKKIVANVIGDLIQQVAVCVTHFVDVRGIDDDLTVVCNGGPDESQKKKTQTAENAETQRRREKETTKHEKQQVRMGRRWRG